MEWHWEQARDQFRGKVTNPKLGGVVADVTIDIGNVRTISAAITRESAERLGLAKGKGVIAMVKATEVIVAIEG
jgi:molybdopterin-binding protein